MTYSLGVPLALGPFRISGPALAAHAAFVLTGVVTTLLGPLLPAFGDRWALDDARAGFLFTAQFAGSMIGVAASTGLAAQRGYLTTIATGLLLMSVGVGGLGVARWPGALVLVVGYGVGLGLAIPATNLFVADSAPDRRSEALNLLNLAWGAGAVAAPPIVGWLTAQGRTDAFTGGLAVALLVAAIALLVLGGRESRRPSSQGQGATGRVPWRSPLFFAFAAIFYLYVGTENAVSGWVAVHARRIDPSEAALASPAFFWGALLAGRGAAPLLLARMREARLIQSGLMLAAVGVVLLIGASGLLSVFVAVAACGLGLAAVFPTTIAQLSRSFGDSSARAAAAAFMMAGLGGATLPPLVGRLSTTAGDLRVGLVVPLVCCVLMLALTTRTQRTLPTSF